MQVPIYIIYELLIRLQDLNTGVGEYLSYKKTDDGVLIRTSTGLIAIKDDMLSRQFNDPGTIHQQEIVQLLEGFKLST